MNWYWAIISTGHRLDSLQPEFEAPDDETAIRVARAYVRPNSNEALVRVITGRSTGQGKVIYDPGAP